jgi:uncharacterized integral membrane protein
MPKQLILFIVIFAVVLLFVAFNLTNKCDISFGFTKIKDAPVFLTVFVSFFLGMLCALPFMIGAGLRKSNTKRPDKKQGGPGLLKKADSLNNTDKDSGKPSGESEYSDRSTYGID